MSSLVGLSLKKIRIQDVHHNNWNNLEATFVKLSEKIQYFITEFIDVLQQFTVLSLWRSKERKNRFVINEYEN